MILNNSHFRVKKKKEKLRTSILSYNLAFVSKPKIIKFNHYFNNFIYRFQISLISGAQFNGEPNEIFSFLKMGHWMERQVQTQYYYKISKSPFVSKG